MEEKNLLISVIVPVYKVEQYLSRCIDSIIHQTYQNLEIILVDDGSPDRCGKICDEYAKQDSRIRVIHKENGGLSDARNVALDVMTGDYVMFVDSDDWIDPETCETVLHQIIEHQADIVVFGFSGIDSSGKVSKTISRLKGEISKSMGMRSLILNDMSIKNYVWNKIFKSSLFEGIRFPKGFIYEDQGTTYKLFHKADSIFVVPASFYYYYKRSDSITTIWYRPISIKSRLRFWKERLLLLEKYYPENVDAQISQILGEMYIGRIKLSKETDYEDFIKDLKEFQKRYHPDIRVLKQYNRRLKLYYYCRPLFYLYVKFYIKS